MNTTLIALFPCLLICASSHCAAAPVNRTAAGANPAAIQATVDQFRADLGGANNGVGGTFITGRREINWDGVPDSVSAPNFLPVDFFNANSPRGAVFSTFTTFNNSSAFSVSADSNNPTATAVRFANLDPSYSAIFQTFSAERLFVPRNQRVLDVQFFLPGTQIPATVSGFGTVFCDVDQAGPTYIKYYGTNGQLLSFLPATTANNGLSFVGVSFNAGERVSRVTIVCGTQIAVAGNIDGMPAVDVVAMDDFIYGEPQPLVVAAPASANLPATVIEAHVPMSLAPAPSQAGVPDGFLRLHLRCSPHHTYRFFSSIDLVNWFPSPISGNAVGPNINLKDPRTGSLLYGADNVMLGVAVDVQKSGPNRFYRAVDQFNAEAAASMLVP